MAKYEIAFTLHNIIKVSLDLKALPLIYRVVISFLQEGLVSNMESVYHDVYNKTFSMYCFQPLDQISYIYVKNFYQGQELRNLLSSTLTIYNYDNTYSYACM